MIPQRDIDRGFSGFSPKINDKSGKAHRMGGFPRDFRDLGGNLITGVRPPPDYPCEIVLAPDLRHVFQAFPMGQKFTVRRLRRTKRKPIRCPFWKT
jgi:hypothetical protein